MVRLYSVFVPAKWPSQSARSHSGGTALLEASSQLFTYFIVIAIWRLFKTDQMKYLRYHLAYCLLGT